MSEFATLVLATHLGTEEKRVHELFFRRKRKEREKGFEKEVFLLD